MRVFALGRIWIMVRVLWDTKCSQNQPSLSICVKHRNISTLRQIAGLKREAGSQNNRPAQAQILDTIICLPLLLDGLVVPVSLTGNQITPGSMVVLAPRPVPQGATSKPSKAVTCQTYGVEVDWWREVGGRNGKGRGTLGDRRAEPEGEEAAPVTLR
jgi:hypothetical protein